MKDRTLTVLVCLVILVLAVMFGLKAMPTEMGIIVVAGAIFLSFLHIDKIQRFKGAGFEAEMRQAVEEANATVHQLRDVATTSTKATLTTLMASSFGFQNGMNLSSKLDLHDKLISDLKKIGASEQQIEHADEMWRKGVSVIFHRGILKAIKKTSQINPDVAEQVKAVSEEFQEFLNFDTWCTATPEEMKSFINDKGVMNPDIEELLEDYSIFVKTGTYRRRKIFVAL